MLDHKEQQNTLVSKLIAWGYNWATLFLGEINAGN
jgi:hypothetical protein